MALVGNLKDCKIEVKPVIQVHITLAQIDIPNLLAVTGICHVVTNSVFKGPEHPVTFDGEPPKEIMSFDVSGKDEEKDDD